MAQTASITVQITPSYLPAKLGRTLIRANRRRIRLIEGNAKCRHIKNWLVKGFLGRCLSFWGPEPIYHSPYTLYICYTVYFFTQGRGGGSWAREKGRGATWESTEQSWVENTSMTECAQEIDYLQSMNSEHLPQSHVTGKFLDDDILHCLLLYESYLSARPTL